MSSPFAAAAEQEFPEDGWGVRWNEEAKRWEARAGPSAIIPVHEPPAAADPDPDANRLERVGSGDAAGSTSSDLAERPARRRPVPSRRYSPSAAQQLEDETRGRPGGPSKYRGVIWHKSNSKWEARIYDNGKQRFLGYFTSEEEAARVYDEAAMRIGGRGARTNFPAGECLSRSSSAPAELLDVGGPQGLGAAPAPAAQSKGGRLRKKPAASAGTTGAIKGSSKYRGVSWNSNCSKWRAQVWKGNDVRHLGYFEDEVAAARSYDRAVLELRGPHAPTNFAPEDYGMASADTDGVDSPFLGVSWDAAAGSWKAELWDGKEYALLGHYDSEEAAARAYDRACLAQHGEAANTNYPPNDYETEMAAAALISAVQRMSDDEEEDNSDLEMSALEALASISNKAEVDSDAGDDAACSSGRNRGSKEQQEGSEQASPRCDFQRRDSGPPFGREVPPSVRLRRATSDPIERTGSLSRRRSTRLSDADAATAAAALAGLFAKPEASEDAVAGTSAGAATASRSVRSARSGGSADAPKSSAYKGVSWHKHSQKWYAYIQAAGKMRGLGYFDHQEDAARAYDTEARKVHGKKAVVNFRMYPDDVVREPKGRGVSSSSADTSLPSLEHVVNGSASFGEEEQALARSASVSGARGGRPGRRGGRADRAGSPTSEEVSRGTPRVGSSRSSKYRGVSWHKHRRMWQVYVHVQSQAKNSYHLGYFANEVDAAKAYDREILKVRGKDAVTNFPESELCERKDRDSAERHLLAAPAAADGGQATEGAGSPKHASAQPLSIAVPPTTQDQAMLEDGEASPTCSAFSLGTLPLRKRSRKPKHVHSTADARSPSPPRLPKPPRKDAADAKQQQWQGSPTAEGGMQLRKGGRRAGSPQKEPRAPGAAVGGGGSEGGGEARASFRGVTRLERERKWVARVWNGQKQLTLGRFDTDVAAAQAYDREMLRMKGPAAVTNFPAHTYGLLSTAHNGQQRGGGPEQHGRGSERSEADLGPSSSNVSSRAPATGEGVVGESDVPSPRRPVPRAHQGSPARGFLHPSNIAIGAEREAQMALPGSRSSSQYRGVTWNGAVGKWAAVVWNSDTKKPQHLGFFDIEEQAARAYDAALQKQPGPGPAVLNFPHAALPPAPSNNALAHVQRPTSAGSGVSSTDVVLDVLASMTPQSASQPSGQAARQDANIEQLASLLRSGAAVPTELAQALQLLSRGQHPALGRSPLQASVATASPSPSPSAGPATASALPQPDNARPESAPHLNGAAAMTGQIEQTPSPLPNPLQNRPAAQPASPGASPNMDRAQRAAALGPKVQRGANTSVYRGVSLNKASGKFEARIREQGKNHYLGSFSDEAEAARAFDAAVIAMRGRTAVRNFPAEDSPSAGQGGSPKAMRQVTQRASPQGQPAVPVPAAAAAAATPPPDQAQGVWFDADKQLWVAEARLGGRCIPVGTFKSEAEALRAHRATLEAVKIKSEAVAPGQRQDHTVHEADLRPDDIVGAHQAGVEGQPNAMTGNEGVLADEHAQNPVASPRGGIDLTLPPPGPAGDSWPGIAAPLARTVGSTVAALRGRVQQMGGSEARAWPGPGRRSSQYKGVSWSEASAKWRAQCWDGSKVKYIGYFDGEEDAARAYDTAMLALRGNAAQTNFLASDYPADAIARAEKHVWGQQHRGRSEEPAEGVKAEVSGRVRIPSRRVASPTNAAAHTGRAAPPNFAYHQGTSQYKGVSWSERSRKWRAQLWHENKVNHLGFYELEEDAARAYDAAVIELRGASAGVNFPAPGTQRPLVSSRTITMCPPGGPSTTVVVEAIPRINVNPKGSSKYRGVRWHERNGKWEARIFDSNSGKQVSLGYYDSEDAAARAYDAESMRIRGPHAHVNLPLDEVPAPARANGRSRRRRASPEGGSDEEEDTTWPVKRPRGYNPAIGRGDLQSMAAAAAVIASTRPPEPGSTKGPRTSCYRGVVWDLKTQTWAVRLATRGGERRQFGMFDTEEEAAIAYDAAVLELFGPYTPTNFDTEYGPAGSPVVPVPKRPRTESSAAARVDAALFLLDTAVVSPSLVGPLTGSLQDAQSNFSTGNLASDVRRAVQARLGPPQPGAPAPAATNSRNDPERAGMTAGMGGGVDVPVSFGVAADAGGVNVPFSYGNTAEAGGVDGHVSIGASINTAQRGSMVVGTPPRPHQEPPAGSIQPGSPPSPMRLQPGLSDRSPGAANKDHAGPLHMQNEAQRMKRGVGTSVGVLHVPTPLKLPVVPAAAARDRPDSAGFPAEFLMRFK